MAGQQGARLQHLLEMDAKVSSLAKDMPNVLQKRPREVSALSNTFSLDLVLHNKTRDPLSALCSTVKS